MSVRNCAELGINLQKIITRLLADQELCKLLYYTDKDPLSQPDIEDTTVLFNDLNLITMIPQNNPVETAQSKIIIVVKNALRLPGNREFRNILIRFYIYVPISQWLIRNTNLRPFLIAGRIQEDLDGKNINGLGTMEAGDFRQEQTTEQMTLYRFDFSITDFN